MAFTIETADEPYRVKVYATGDWVATFTPGCYTVTTAGPERTFTEKYRDNGRTGSVQVQHSTWVRAAPGPVPDEIDHRWLNLALNANQEGIADVLAIAMQYLKRSQPVYLGGLQIAGDASYGPLRPDGTRDEGSDFSDYLGLRWLYPADPPDDPESQQFRCLDCSGFLRMLWGYRHHLPESGYPASLPLSLRPKDHTALPRRAVEMYKNAPGLILETDNGIQLTDFQRIRIGDLVFFDGSNDDGDALDHVGMYLGVDIDGHHRFVSSRETPDGPTFADRGRPSLLDGAEHYAKAFRAVRRL